jgi:hypothetical protein
LAGDDPSIRIEPAQLQIAEPDGAFVDRNDDAPQDGMTTLLRKG